MFKLSLVALGVVLAGSFACAAERRLFDFNWRFHLGEVEGAQRANFDDSDWTPVDLPHDWSIEHPADPHAPSGAGGGYFRTGVGWYRHQFRVPEAWHGRRLALEFEGVYRNADVWLNGEHLTQHDYGYTPFRVELGRDLNPHEPHTIAVRVDNSKQPNSRWYSGSGIYRHAWLTAFGDVHVAHDSLHVVTESLDNAKAAVDISAEVLNESDDELLVEAVFECYSPDGRLVATDSAEVSAAANNSVAVDSKLAVRHPLAWSPDSPQLYRLKVRLEKPGEVLDQAATQFGIRTVTVDAQQGLLLNGRAVNLFGGNVHHDNGPLGAAAFDRAEERRVELLKAAGFNAVRTAHNPPSTAFLDACDRFGLLVIDEAFDGWKQHKVEHDYGAVFDEHWRRDLSTMIKRDRNHPSVIAWSVGNEMYERGDPETVELSTRMVREVRRHDDSRPVTAGINGLGPGNWHRLDALFATLDLAGYNYERDRFVEDRQRVPQRVMLSTESYPHELQESHQVVDRCPFVVGDFVWSAMDYLGEAGIGRVFAAPDPVVPHWEGNHYPWHGATCGDIDICGHRKPISHFRNIVWNRGEMLRMAVVQPPPEGSEWRLSQWAVPPMVESWTWPGHEGQSLDVHVYSRWPKVAVEHNGQVVDQWQSDEASGFRKVVPVRYKAGTLRLIGYDEKGEQRESFEVATAGSPERLRLTSDRSVLSADGQDLAFVTVEVVDGHGIVCPNTQCPIEYTLTGPAAIVAIGSGDLASEQTYQQNPRRCYQGRALVVVRSARTVGTVSLTASADGLQSASSTIVTNNPVDTAP